MGAPVVLCFLLREGQEGSEVLLGRKRRGFGVGKIVGLGGHIEAGETAAQAARRELAEEACVELDAAAMRAAGTVDFRFPARPEWDMACTMFTCTRWEGEVCTTEEIEPEWFPVDALPVDRMWQDADHWLPIVLTGAWAVPPDFLVEMAEDNETVARFAVLGP
ncbi:8-oxo-dGTP diphosphatase [Sinomonas halotolerans]|uniref:Oxidized purine nucleoside triphosphate hydrolase n=1 Tax=Sinomonas halotolerans TaxID=1644133 RepID=A0ABU9X5W4_9MICC